MHRLVILPILLVACLRADESSAYRTWYPNNVYVFSDRDVGSASWGNMSYWVDANDNSGTGAPAQNDNLIFASNTRKRFRFKTNVGVFTGRSIQFGTAECGATVVHDNSGTVKFNNDGLKL